MNKAKSKDRYTHKKGLVYKNQYHIIFCPKYRRPVLIDGVDVRLKQIIVSVVSEFDASLKAMEVMPDHVHCLWKSIREFRFIISLSH